MAIKGLSKFVVGLYNNNNGVVTYTTPTTIAKMIEYTLTINSSDNNPLYADNMVAENDKGTFQSGELTMGTDELTQESSMLILGLKENEYTYGNKKTVKELVYDDDSQAPYLGVGFIEWHQHEDVNKYRAVFLPKVFFNIPEQAATTKGESVEWQTPSIPGTIQRSDSVEENMVHPWMNDAWFSSENDALEYLEYKCGKIDEVTPTKATLKVGESK